jgi:hypothetical protein
VTNTTFSDNSASSGGGIDNLFGTLTVTNCTFTSNNHATDAGGGIFNRDTLTLANSTFFNNSAGQGGGGIDNQFDLRMVNCTLSGNTAGSGQGGGINNSAGLSIANTIIAKNTAATGPDVNGGAASQGYNLVGDGSGSSGFGVPGDQVGTASSPINPLLGPLQDNGGPTQTMALLPGSPAIDAGSDALAVDQNGNPLAFDQRGFVRVENSTVDIGAFEVQVYQVYSTADSGGGSLRTALANANQAGGSVIVLTTGGTINLASALPNMTRSVQILGPGANNLTVQRSTASATPAFRIFTVDCPAGAIQDVTATLSGLTIANGSTDFGGGIFNGAFYNGTLATLTVTNCTLAGNTASASGGGIYNGAGNLVVNSSTLSGNSASVNGGGIRNFGLLALTNSTLAGNSAGNFGGGIGNDASAALSNCTLSGNAAAMGGGIDANNGTLTVANTIVAGNSASTGPDVNGTIASQGYNLFGDPSGAAGLQTSDLRNLDPLLAPLGNYGGPTQTMALLPGSPAINAGSNGLAVDPSGNPLLTDQRGLSRIVNGPVDIGAFESRGFVLGVAGATNQQTTVFTPFAAPLSVGVISPFGEPVQGGLVTFFAPPSGASAIFPLGNQATINASGLVSQPVFANATTGTYNVTASANGAAEPAVFTLTNLPGIALNPASLPDATAGIAYSQTLTASGGAGGPYAFAVTAGALPAGFTLSSSGVLSGSTTTAATSSFTVAATDHSGFTGSQAYTLTVDPAVAASFVVSGFPSPTTAGVAGNFSVVARDAFGNVATGYGGTVHFTSSDRQAVLPANATLSGGTGTFNATLKTAGSQSLTAQDTLNASLSGSQSGIVVNPAATSKFVVSGFPSPVTAGVAGTFTVTAEDTFGNLTPAYTGTVHFSSSDPQAVLPANATLTNGTGTFSATLKTAALQSLTATDTTNGTITGSQTGITVTPGVVTHFVFVGPFSVTSGRAFNLTVKAVDAYGNVATGYRGTVKFASSDNSATLPGKYTFTAADNGMHPFTGLVLKKRGTQTITVFDGSNSSILGTISINVL